MTVEINPRLMCKARTLPVTYGLIERPAQLGGGRMWVKRCADCGDVIYPPSSQGRLAHLLAGHGYRMDGRQFDARNNLIGAA